MTLKKKTKSLESSRLLGQMIKKFYTNAHEAKLQGKPVVWTTAEVPLEAFYAMDIQPIYPESYSAANAAKGLGVELCQQAEEAGWSVNVCSYCRINIGHILSGKGTLGGIPKPDFMVVGRCVCLQELTWWEYVARFFHVPLIVLDMPVMMRNKTGTYLGASVDRGGIPDHAMEYAVKGIKKFIRDVETVSGRKMDWDKFKVLMERSARAANLWHEIDLLRNATPSPVSSSDMFGFIFALADMSGSQETVELFIKVRDEIKGRVLRKEGAIPEEKYRLFWINLPVWYDLSLYYLFESYGAAFVAETYSYLSWGRRVDPDYPLESIVLRMIGEHYNLSMDERWELYTNIARERKVDGAVFFVNMACKLYTMDHLESARILKKTLGIPSLMVHGDHGDPRMYNRTQVENRVLSFLETLAEMKKRPGLVVD